jgi:hypothetical protein
LPVERKLTMADGRATSSDEKERDFGDSAGYGSGGSTRDYRDVVGDENEYASRPNPLDAVMRDTGRRPHDVEVLSAVLLGLAVFAVPLGFYAWRRTQPQRDQERRARMGRSREALARMQM